MTAWLSTIQAWIYPGAPADNANVEYADGRVIDTLRPEYLTLSSTGVITQINDTGTTATKNAYSVANAADVKAHSTRQWITVSGSYTGIHAVLSNSTKRTNAINTMVAMVATCGFTGIDIDWEDFASWTATDYTNFKTMMANLGTSLHASGYTLSICVPPITNTTEDTYYQINYEDWDAITQVDYITAMLYDRQYDFGGGTSISPNTWVQDGCDRLIARISNINRIIVGMPSYGYHATNLAYDIAIDTYTQSTSRTGFAGATRNGDYEMNWLASGIYSEYQDTSSMNSKRTLIEAKGIKTVSVWHLGGNQWFTGTEPVGSTTTIQTTQPYIRGVKII